MTIIKTIKTLLVSSLLTLCTFHLSSNAQTLNGIYIEAPSEYDSKIDKQVLNNILGQYVGQGISVPLLNNIVKSLNSFYTAHGFIGAQALYPYQKASDGNVKVVIDNLKVRLSDISNETEIPYVKVYELLVDARANPGESIKDTRINDHLLKVKDLGAFNVDMVLTPVSQEDLDNDPYLYSDPSYYMMNLVAKKKQRFNASAYLDNHGTKNTGRTRFTALISSNNLTNNVDKGLFGFSITEKGQTNTVVDYAYPFNGKFLYIGSTVNYGAYSVKGTYSLGKVKGSMLSYDAYITDNLYRDSFFKTDYKVGAYIRNIKDSFVDYSLNLKRKNAAAYSLVQNAYHNVENTLFVNSDLKLSFAKTNNKDEYELYSQTPYFLLNTNHSLRYFLTKEYSFDASLNMQLANKQVDPIDLFNAGGNDAVKAYQTNLAAADNGLFLSTGITKHNYDLLNSKFSINLQQAHLKNTHSKAESFFGVSLQSHIDYKGFFADMSISKAFGKNKYLAEDSVKAQVQFGYNY